ncbi:MAG: methionyl-tRNA formyltransferase [Proteobacteria bacterium]|nr:methionyl-tRNA formyltransferase [Pseudomonadota bacterium]
MLRILLMGGAEYVVPVAEKLLNLNHPPGHLVGVVCPPTQRLGKRGAGKNDSALAIWAKSRLPSILCLQPENPSSPEFIQVLSGFNCDMVITAAYGQILSEEFLKVPTYGVLNIHPSLLPKYRGATPVPGAILAGDTETGVSFVKTVRELDAGDIVLQQSVSILPNEKADELLTRLFYRSSLLVAQACALMAETTVHFMPQEHQLASYSKKLNKTDGLVDFNESAYLHHLKFRAYAPWPGRYSYFDGKRVRLSYQESGVCVPKNTLSPGGFIYDKQSKALVVGIKGGIIQLDFLTVEGKKTMTAREFWHYANQRDTPLIFALPKV